MKKFYLLFAAMIGFAAVANAGVKNLYKQDFEGVTDPAAAGWTSPNLQAGLTIQSDDYGSFLSWSCGGNNGRSAYLLFAADGENIYEGALVDGTYHLQFDWSFAANANNQYSSEVMVFTDAKPAANNAQLYANENAHYLFAISQLNADMEFAINGETTNIFVPEVGAWYVISMDVNVNTSTVTWKIEDIAGVEKASGTRTLPEGTEPYAQGINVLSSRYNSQHLFDNIAVQVITDYDIANVPSVALTGINGTDRTYTISFGEEETLHVKAPGASEVTADYASTYGSYSITVQNSGTLEAWTTSGEAVSEHAYVEVECVEIALPAATATIAGVQAGYAKTYELTVSNADVPTQPQLFLSYLFEAEDGSFLSGEELISGAKIEIPSKGVLNVTTKAVGFTQTTIKVDNDKEFAVDNSVDFQHMSAAQLTAKGFEKVDDLNSAHTSGENNWTARLRLYFSIATGEKDAEGKDIATYYPVYGFNMDGTYYDNNTKETLPMTQEVIDGAKANGNTPTDMTVAEPIQRYKFYQSGLTEEVAHSIFAPVYTWYFNDGVTATSVTTDEDGNVTGPAVDANGNLGGTTNLQVKVGIGLVHSGVQGDAENYDPAGVGYGNIRINNATMGVDGLTDDDFIIVYKIGDYGTSSVHPQFPAGTSVEDAKAQYKASNLGGVVEVYKGTETFTLNRVDAAITRIETFAATNNTGIENVNTGVIVSDHNAPIFNLNGVQVNPSTLKKGVYVKQGKKFVVQ